MAGLLIPADDAVAAELRRWAATPFDWTRDNCGLAVLYYVERVTMRRLDPAPCAVGRIGMLRMIDRAGGYLTLARRTMARLECPQTAKVRRGDVGLIMQDSDPIAAIALEAGQAHSVFWAARGDRAAVIRTGEPLAAWRVACHRQ